MMGHYLAAAATAAPLAAVSSPVGAAFLTALWRADTGVLDASGQAIADGQDIGRVPDLSGNGHDLVAFPEADRAMPWAAADARAGGRPAFGAQFGNGNAALLSPSLTVGRAYVVATHNDGTSTEFLSSRAPALLGTDDGPFGSPHVVGEGGTADLFVDGRSFATGARRNGAAAGVTLLPMARALLTLDAQDDPPGTFARTVGGLPRYQQRTWPGAVELVAFTDGTEPPGDVERWIAAELGLTLAG